MVALRQVLILLIMRTLCVDGGTAVLWGSGRYGIDVSSVHLINVADIMCRRYTCVARKNDRTVVACWGLDSDRGDASIVDLTNIADIMRGRYARVAHKNDRTTVGRRCECRSYYVACIMRGWNACVARKSDGTAVV